MSTSTPKKRNDLTLADKVKVIQLLDSVPKVSQAEVAKKFDCSQPQVSRAYKNKAAILQQWEANGNPNRKRKRDGKDGDVEEALLRWYVNARAKSAPLSGPILKEKAKALAECFGDSGFNPTDGWLSRWKKRNNVVLGRAREERLDMVVESATEPVEKTAILDAVHPTSREVRQNVFQRATNNYLNIASAENSVAEEVVAPSTVTIKDESQFGDIDVKLECTSNPIYHDAGEARSSTSADSNDTAENDIGSTRPPPTQAEVYAALDVIRRWVYAHDVGYSAFAALEQSIYSYYLKARKQQTIKDFFRPRHK